MSHTPGPWRHDKELSMAGAPMITARMCWMGMSRNVAKVLYHNGSEDPEVDANACLIAAAPELLEALKALCEAVPKELDERPYETPAIKTLRLTAAYVGAQQAIAKAEANALIK